MRKKLPGLRSSQRGGRLLSPKIKSLCKWLWLIPISVVFLSVDSMIFTPAYLDGVDLGFSGDSGVLDSLPSVFPKPIKLSLALGLCPQWSLYIEQSSPRNLLFIFLHFLQIFLFKCHLLCEVSFDYIVCNSTPLMPWHSFPAHSILFSLKPLTPSDILYIYLLFIICLPPLE